MSGIFIMRSLQDSSLPNACNICRPGKEGKEFGVPIESSAFVDYIQTALKSVQSDMYAEALAFRDANIKDVKDYDELGSAISEGFWARGPWAGESSP